MSHALIKDYFEENRQVAEYLDARNAFLSLDKIIDELAVKINNVGHTLANWRGMFLFSDCKTKLSTESLADLQDNNFSAANWPTPEQINEALVLWHTARNRQRQLWKAIPHELRQNLDLPF